MVQTLQSRQFVFRYILLISIAFLLTFINVLSKNELLIIFSMVFIALISLFLVNFNITHPYTWFIPFYLLYSISYSLLVLNGEYQINVTSELVDSLLLSWIGLVTLLILISPKIIEIKPNNTTFLKYFKHSSLLFNLSFCGVTLMCIYILSSGALNKKDISLDNSMFVTLGFYCIHFFVFYFVVKLINGIINREYFSRTFVGTAFITALLVIFIAGERDFLLRLVLILVIVYDLMVKKIPKLKLFLFGFVGLFIIGVLQDLKNLFLRSGTLLDSEQGILSKILGGEFTSSGRNLQLLIQNNMGGLFSENTTLITDIKYALTNLPFISKGITTPTSWFNLTFYADYSARGGGKGFTYLGEGFINFGAFGVVLWCSILAIIINFFYKLSNRSGLGLVMYLVIIPNVIYCMRADLGIFLSILLKYVLFPALFIYVSTTITSYNYQKNNRLYTTLEAKKE